MTVRDVIAKWANRLVTTTACVATDVRIEMDNWLRTPAADVVEVPREKIEALRKSNDAASRVRHLVPLDDATYSPIARLLHDSDAILACAEPVNPKDEILAALEAVLVFTKGCGNDVYNKVHYAIELRRKEIEERSP